MSIDIQGQHILSLERKIESLKNTLLKYKKAPKIQVGAKGGWWWVINRPTGKNSVKKQGNYIRDPFNN